MVYEKGSVNKHAFIGYNSKDLKQYIDELFKQHEDEIKFLQSRIEEETQRNQQLKKKLELQKLRPSSNPIAEEMKVSLMDLFIQHTKEIMELQAELEEQVKEIQEDWNRKLLEKELIKKRFKDTLQDIKGLTYKKYTAKKVENG